jgi:hypothetical protein
MDQTAWLRRLLRRPFRGARLALSLCGVVAIATLVAACGSAASPSISPAGSPGNEASPALSPSPTPAPSGSAAVQQLPEWFRAMAMRVSRWWGDPHPQQAWWALTSDEKAQLAGGTPGGNPERQVYFAIVQGEFRSGQYQFFGLEADPRTHKKLRFVSGGGFDRTFVGPMTAFEPSASTSTTVSTKKVSATISGSGQ